MDEVFEWNGITFVWDRKKAKKNVEKHGVTFQQATSAFFDPFLCVVDASPEEEARDAIIGMDENWDMLFVVHIVVEDDRIRIVSARKATGTERRDYES